MSVQARTRRAAGTASRYRTVASRPFRAAARRTGVTLCAAAAGLGIVSEEPLRARTPSALPQAADAPGTRPGVGPAGPGVVSVGLLIRQLDGVKRVLVVGAHPDDEDTALLAALARGLGARAAYLSLTRGEGGQNLIGPELGEGLGIVRTGELMAARRLDGAEQYFTRAYDFGYSKSAEETFLHWPRDSLLRDVVWVIRTFRPQVIVSIFGGTSEDGHGQHQAAGQLTREAFEVAGDPSRFPEQLAAGVGAWTPVKLYRRTWRDPEAATLTVETGRLDPLLGRSHFQVAMEARSKHRSQDFGVPQPPGPQVTALRLLASRAAGPDTSLFAGVDTALAAFAKDLPETRSTTAELIAAYRTAVRRAADGLSAFEPADVVPELAAGLKALRDLQAALAASRATAGDLGDAVRHRSKLLQEAILAAASIDLTARSDDDLVVPGQTLRVEVDLWNGGPLVLRPSRPDLKTPPGWHVAPAAARRSDGDLPPWYPEAVSSGKAGDPLDPAALRRWGFEVRVAEDARPTDPYYLGRDRADDLYRWPEDPSLHGLPRTPPPVEATIEFELGPLAAPAAPGRAASVRLEVTRTVGYRGVDKSRGEYWRPLHVVPALSVEVRPEVLVWPTFDPGPRSVAVTVRSADTRPRTGRVRLDLPPGWSSEPEQAAFELPGAGASISTELDLHAPAIAPEGTLDAAARAVATTPAGDEPYRHRVRLIDYSHIAATPLVEEAAVRLRRFPVLVTDRRVGYVMGSGDAVPEAIRQLGLSVERIGPSQLHDADFDRYDVVVLGVRAYEVVPELATSNARLLEWARRGGVVVVQYNKHEFFDGRFAPYPLSTERPAPRVTDEAAPVKILSPDAPVFSTPNRITEADFAAWVQERGLYFPSDWDSAYLPLLELADPGEPARRGSLLVAPIGSGLYVYTALSFFRQLPAGVSGAYRLFANLLSSDPRAWRGYLAETRSAPRSGTR